MQSTFKQILLVEDNLGDAELLGEILEDASVEAFAIAHVQRVSEALTTLHESHFDIILLDLWLPDSHGLETLQRVQSEAPSIPIVVITGLNDEAQAVKAVREGAQDYLVKGQLDGRVIARALNYAIERKQILEALRESEERFQLLAANLDRQVQERTAQLQQSLHFEAMLKRITDKVRDSLDESQILQTAVQELAIGLGVDSCNAGIYDANHSISMISYKYGDRTPYTLGQVVQISESPEIYPQLLQGKSFQFSQRVADASGAKSTILAVPIFDEREAIGDLWLFKLAEESFEEVEIRLVQQVANQCAIALRQARLYQASQSQVRELERLNQLKDHFLSSISHELRTPVANIKMATQMLEIIQNQQNYNSPPQPTQKPSLTSPSLISENPNLSPSLNSPFNAAQKNQTSADRYFQILHEECEREISLINNILELQRLEAGVEPIDLAQIKIQYLIPYLIETIQAKIDKNQQILRLNLDPSLPALECDTASLERILTELLNNACKYTPPHEEIIISARAEESILQLEIRNTGVEIPASELAHIFEKFYRVPSNDPWKHSGTGLGLALVQKLSEHLGGKIHAISGNGETAFILELPLVPVNKIESVI